VSLTITISPLLEGIVSCVYIKKRKKESSDNLRTCRRGRLQILGLPKKKRGGNRGKWLYLSFRIIIHRVVLYAKGMTFFSGPASPLLPLRDMSQEFWHQLFSVFSYEVKCADKPGFPIAVAISFSPKFLPWDLEAGIWMLNYKLRLKQLYQYYILPWPFNKLCRIFLTGIFQAD
jgi:hypothetical protein